MQQFHGVGVTPGRVVGPVRQMPAPVREPHANVAMPAGVTVESETERIKAASKAVQTELRARAAAATGDAKSVLEATALMASDPMLVKGAVKLLHPEADGGPRTAERAVWESGAAVAEKLRGLGGYMAERAADVLDVRGRIVAELRGLPAPGVPTSDVPFVLTAEDLAPADTATLDPSKVLALVTSGGGPQSHTAILARALGLPAVVAAEGVDEIPDGTEVFVDGAAGRILTDPAQAERDAAAAWAAQATALASFAGDNRLADGHPVPLLANVATGADAAKAAAAGAEGVGLLRTEFAFLDRDTEPAHDEQVAAYGAVFEHFAGKKVVIRTLDAGADKPLPFLTDTQEPNPALGVRGYRTDAASPGVLARQLAAIAQAAKEHEADVWVMAPMVSTPDEAAAFTDMAHSAGLKTAGVMVEVPSAALTASHILANTDFASLGTNDLTQYTMAADRMLGPLATLNDPWQPAVLHLVKATCDGATTARAATGAPKSVGVCGEAAADPGLAVVLAGLGVTTLSMTPRALPAVAHVLATVTMAQAQDLARQALAAPSAEAARQAVRAALPILDELGL
ncbi:phosphoenolpyruvate--protein phosphotransferase [Sinomonas sp. JGH33]|uniref:Phosphoenolpyruvate-protein phosphotransferase n=1 Tax=Sinomonas terricola TaxID=3110330 RepID=A0ABU5T597_9MICC|nr:phosphoenolpyruvate--protein phosphotransferase [Sinomonas sp. JGH33]MEA5454839.1 phosphoenolpyruvate--protein phosphotransferase [Sinomonas sp. JGH33]